jgi:hypothetical protein
VCAGEDKALTLSKYEFVLRGGLVSNKTAGGFWVVIR